MNTPPFHVSVQNITKLYGYHKIFSTINFEHSQGIFCIVGTNGTGKTTLLKCLSMIIKPSMGDIVWRKNNHKITKPILLSQSLYIAPYIHGYESLSVLENAQFWCQLRQIQLSKEEIINHCIKLGLKNQLNIRYNAISDGQRQRLMLFPLVAFTPNILFADEPFIHLDKQGEEYIKNRIIWLSQQGCCIFITMHQPPQDIPYNTILSLNS